ncbi:MAG: NmrA family NAD(P)-binding protein [bacterium]|nr:NmrA family NAD(P)-binding protein [bacterium]
MILVTGAAGKTGWAIIRALARRGESVRAMVRRAEQVASLEAIGATEVILGDLLDGSAVHRAVHGVQAIYHIAPNVSPHEVTIGERVITAARFAGVEHFVFHSVLHPQVEAMPHHWLKMRVEELLFASGLFFTILQPSAYMQNMLAYLDAIREQGVYKIPYPPHTRLSLIDLEDLAEAAAIILSEPEWRNATLELVGTSGLSQQEIAHTLGRQLSRPVEAEAIPIETWQANARSAGLGEYQIETLSKMFAYYAQHGLVGSPRVLGCLLKREPTSFEEFVERTI